VQVGADGTFTSPIVVPTYVGAGESWVFVAVLADAKVTAAPILITAAASNPTAVPAPPNNGVNVPVNGQFTRTNMYLIALEDNGQSGEMIGCNDSVIPVIVDIEPTVAPLTAVLNRMLGLNDQFYGESGLYNAFYQSDLSVQGINIVNRQAVINLTGTLQLGGTCDGPRVRAQLEKTALQYGTVDSVAISINGQSLDSILSGQ
jgi:hypothetical protein